MPDYGGSDCSPDLRRDKGRSESPVLGESVSMYEEEKVKEVYHDILSKVNKLLAEPEQQRGRVFFSKTDKR